MYALSNPNTLTYAKYHGNCYRVQMDATDPSHTRAIVLWEPAYLEPRHEPTLEQRCGLLLVNAIVREAYQVFNADPSVFSVERLRASLLELEDEASKQRVYWMEQPDLSQLWNFLPEVVTGKIFSYLNQHEVLQLRGVCQSWRGADNRLWKVWLAVNRVFFPQKVARMSSSFVDFRHSRNKYLRKRKHCEGVELKGENYEKWNKDLWVTEEVILRCDSDYGKEGTPKRIKVIERQSGKLLLTDSCITEIREPRGGGHTTHTYPGWFYVDGLLLGSDIKTRKLKVYDPTSGKLIRSFRLRGQVIVSVRRESEFIIATLSEGKLLQRWNLQSGILESTLDLSQIHGGNYADARFSTWDRDSILFTTSRRDGSFIIDLAQPDRLLAILPSSATLRCYGDAYLIFSWGTLGLYTRTPAGELNLLWSRDHVKSEFLFGDTIICDTAGREIVVLNPVTGETERTLFKGEYGVSNDISIDGDKMFINQTPYQRQHFLHVVDIPSGKQLFKYPLPNGASFVGAKGDTLFMKDPKGLYMLEPEI